MVKKKTNIEELLEGSDLDEVSVKDKDDSTLYADEIKEDDLVVEPEKVEPLQTVAKKPAQPFNNLKEDAPRGVGGSYYIDSNGTRVKR